ncbi:helix-turn-helix transcriptional regulator [Acanthopleuribacter pedis]|uniref:WYL domain-containing protein n=1 Tax=Acanthopleuribacter pedis TaxID=442870 RepID=A0A8J7U2U7_9BACT|nr:WYL domain-containing transcriptional regulator [Acanthopleuribacter pedis]MBO1318947.1 WYL domain-containing protein [Acanthopleuribacter pedis]
MSETPPSGKPTYGAAMRVAQIIHWLHEHPIGLSLKDLTERLGIHERTLSRYLKEIRTNFLDHDGVPLVEVVRQGDSSRLRFRRRDVTMEGSAYELMSLYMALDFMTFLDGTFIHEGAQDVFDKILAAVHKTQGHQVSMVMKDFKKKFFHFTEAPKDYSSHNAALEKLVQALVHQKKIEIVYQSPRGPKKTHQLSPLTMLMYKRALYLVGRRDLDPDPDRPERKRDLTFAVERIAKVTLLDERFWYPEDYRPEERFQSSFGLISEKEPEKITLRFDKLVAQNVASRRWHHSQKNQFKRDGSLHVTLHIAVSFELKAWILSYGRFVKVLEPTVLIEDLREDLLANLAHYQSEEA